MDEHQNPSSEAPADRSAEPTPGAPGADETFGWTAHDTTNSQAGTGTTAERMVAQLQSMIDSIATQAAPVVRQVGIKAAELAAAAADRAGPIAHKAADATADASVKIAERSRVIAADLRREVANATNGSSTDAGTSADLRTEAAGSDASTAVATVHDDATDHGGHDDPGGDPR
jgi:hypothetical protein